MIKNPTVSQVRAVVTTSWNNKGYRPIVIRNLESYYIDTSIDNDADTWTCDISDPHAKYLDTLQRDSEVRVQLFGVGRQGNAYILSGFADEASYTDEGTLTLTGRDMSSLATDSTVFPHRWRKQRSWKVVEAQARQLGFTRTNVSHGGKMHNTIYTDGSESYWEFWYRLARQDKQFLWCEPNGTLVQHNLNYSANPSYFLGWPHPDDSKALAELYMPVERLEIHKTTQRRLGEVYVFGNKGDAGIVTMPSVRDPAVKHWIKRPTKVMLDSNKHTLKGLKQVAHEEIFEGKVGSVEYKVTILDPGFVIRQNTIARLYIPQLKLFGEFYVVGTRIQASSDGFLQEIRLREKWYAVSRRVPEAPKLAHVQAPVRPGVTTSLGEAIADLANMPTAWGQYFVKAAKEFHGPWDFNLFLATLLGMSDQEGMRNVREGGNTVWYPPPTSFDAQDAHRHGEEPPERTLDEWQRLFANKAGDPRNPYTSRSVNAEAGVGPMQLTSVNLKYNADDHFRANHRDQFTGGRWHPEHNIWAAAKYFRDLLKSLGDTGQDNMIWSAVSAYNAGHVSMTPGAPGYSYMLSVKNKVLKDPGYLQAVTDALKAARAAAAAAKDGETDATSEFKAPKGIPTKEQCLRFFNSYRPNRASAAERRKAIFMAAVYARRMRPLDWTETFTRGTINPDFAPPPNVPDHMDCSAYVSWCYYSAGSPDPGGTGNYSGWTGPLWNHGQTVSVPQVQVGDLAFYGSGPPWTHVSIYIGNGFVGSHGYDGGPYFVPYNSRSDFGGFKTYRV